MNITETLIESIESDDSMSAHVTKKVRSIYDSANEESRKHIDDIFIEICGYSINTLLEKCD